MSDILFECKSLTKKFGSTIALNNIDLQIKRGQIVGLLGPNGSGKTTLIKIANQLLTSTSGEVLICGEKLNVKTKDVISYLPDCVALPEWMKVKDLISFYSDFYKDFDSEKAYKMLDTLGIDKKSIFKTLSKGTKEKVQLILVMSRNVELYLLDEPMGGVDPATRDFILNTIISNYSKNSTVIISTHLISDVENVLDDVIFINNGNIALHETVDDIRENRQMSVDSLFREVFKC